MGLFALRPGDLLTILKDGFVNKLQKFSFLSPCYPSYGAPNFYPGGIFPTEHTSLRWTHISRVLSSFSSSPF